MTTPPLTRHLLTRTAVELGHVERYRAICGYTGITRRDFSPQLVRTNSKGERINLVTCPKCLGFLKQKGKQNEP